MSVRDSPPTGTSAIGLGAGDLIERHDLALGQRVGRGAGHRLELGGGHLVHRDVHVLTLARPTGAARLGAGTRLGRPGVAGWLRRAWAHDDADCLLALRELGRNRPTRASRRKHEYTRAFGAARRSEVHVVPCVDFHAEAEGPRSERLWQERRVHVAAAGGLERDRARVGIDHRRHQLAGLLLLGLLWLPLDHGRARRGGARRLPDHSAMAELRDASRLALGRRRVRSEQQPARRRRGAGLGDVHELMAKRRLAGAAPRSAADYDLVANRERIRRYRVARGVRCAALDQPGARQVAAGRRLHLPAQWQVERTAGSGEGAPDRGLAPRRERRAVLVGNQRHRRRAAAQDLRCLLARRAPASAAAAPTSPDHSSRATIRAPSGRGGPLSSGQHGHSDARFQDRSPGHQQSPSLPPEDAEPDNKFNASEPVTRR